MHVCLKLIVRGRLNNISLSVDKELGKSNVSLLRDRFCNHFEELQTMLFEVELIINNAPLTYIYPNTIETCLTPNHLLFGRQLLYSSNTTSNRISNHFLDRWRHEYVLCSKFT